MSDRDSKLKIPWWLFLVVGIPIVLLNFAIDQQLLRLGDWAPWLKPVNFFLCLGLGMAVIFSLARALDKKAPPP
jgi:hypothetical protein